MQNAFETLKLKLTSPPVLAFTNFHKTFFVETDASGTAIEALFLQIQEDGRPHPNQYSSRTVNIAERR